MDKKEIIDFFDSSAEQWDENMVKTQWKTDKILDTGGVFKGCRVIDIACGTGVLIPDYVKRGVSRCVGVDFSPKMIEKAKSKFKEYENVDFICKDAENLGFDEEFDCAVVYNAFPHFANPQQLFSSVSKSLKKEGRIVIAHSMSREELIKHHSGRAEKVSTILPLVEELAEMMSPFFQVDVAISNNEIYIASGKKHIK